MQKGSISPHTLAREELIDSAESAKQKNDVAEVAEKKMTIGGIIRRGFFKFVQNYQK